MTKRIDSRNDPYLAFGTFGLPRRVTRPLETALDGTSFEKATCATAAKTIEFLSYLQWLRGGLVGAAGIGLAYLVDRLTKGPLEGWELAAISGSIAWLAFYGFLLLALMVLFRRNPPADPVQRHATLLRVFRYTPLLSLLFAVALAIQL